jgi:hypothetical protein
MKTAILGSDGARESGAGGNEDRMLNFDERQRPKTTSFRRTNRLPMRNATSDRQVDNNNAEKAMQIKLPFDFKLPTDLEKIIRILRAELGPDALPPSLPLLGICLGGFALGQFINLAVYKTIGQSVGIAVAGAVLLVAVTAGSLYLLGYGKRLPQTLIALAGTGALIAAVSFGVRVVLKIGLPEEAPTVELMRFLMFPLLLWNVVVFMRILRIAFSGRLVPSLAVAVAYVIMLEFLVPRYFG